MAVILTTLAALAVGFLALPAEVSAQKCSGMGRRFCSGNAATADECPDICRLKNCRNNRDVAIPQNGVYKYRDWDWVDLAESGKFDNVYIDGDYLCIGSCWYKPWEAKCKTETGPDGQRYCTSLDCSHDRYDADSGGNRYLGCHKDIDGKRKKPFHKPSCEECYHLFTAACGDELERYAKRSSRNNDDDSSSGADSGSSDPAASDSSDADSDSSSGGGVKINADGGNQENSVADDDDYEAEDLEDAPASWQVLFTNEVQPSDDVIIPLVNLLFQLNETMPSESMVEILAIVSQGAGVQPSQVMLLHSVAEADIFPNSTNGLRTVSVGIISTDPFAVNDLNSVLSSPTSFLDEKIESYIDDSFSVSIKYVSSTMVDESVHGKAKLLNREEFQAAMEADAKDAQVEESDDTALIIGLSAAAAGAIILAVASVMAVLKKGKTKPQEEVEAAKGKEAAKPVAASEPIEEEEITASMADSTTV
eukprot:CAMPEP_0117664356 /NCGR_PEP_ID=MMETSP0804-20121206/9172_1 /TAXON_ID=1074897 /ORGANISM="Tetraselmis astigmatica, Strain CCMP880" /LENGTH=477 /DNA_ID=CAMNT_0005471575 /DNA_START=131 /DNA_END=1564 /DNA_ORIENTATION=+